MTDAKTIFMERSRQGARDILDTSKWNGKAYSASQIKIAWAILRETGGVRLIGGTTS